MAALRRGAGWPLVPTNRRFEGRAVVVEVSRRKKRREREASILVIGAKIDGKGFGY